MFKSLAIIFTILVIGGVLFAACKKDPQINPPVTKPSVEVTPPAPFVLKDSIYPRVCKGTFTIKTNTTDSQTVQLYSRWGQLLINLTINGTTAIVDTSLKDGTYFIVITHKSNKIRSLITVLK